MIDCTGHRQHPLGYRNSIHGIRYVVEALHIADHNSHLERDSRLRNHPLCDLVDQSKFISCWIEISQQENFHILPCPTPFESLDSSLIFLLHTDNGPFRPRRLLNPGKALEDPLCLPDHQFLVAVEKGFTFCSVCENDLHGGLDFDMGRKPPAPRSYNTRIPDLRDDFTHP